MGRAGTERPKGFLKVGGQQLIVRSVNHLLDAGIRNIVIVTGHLSTTYDKLAKQYGGYLQLCFNPNFASSGSFESLRVGLGLTREPFLLLESDIIYEPVALQTVIGHPHDNVLLVSGPTGAGDEVYVWSEWRPRCESPVLKGLSKNIEVWPEEPLGELVGIVKIGLELRGLLAHKAEEWRITNPHSDYEAGLVEVSPSSPVTCMKMNELIWAEIDDERMLRRVRNRIYPRLKC